MDYLPNRALLELIFWGQISIIALLVVLYYRINVIKRGQNLIARGITKLMGIVGE